MKSSFGSAILRIAAAMLALMLIGGAALAELDLNRLGSISVRIHTADGTNVENANIVIYRVGNAYVEEANLQFSLVSELRRSGVSLSDMSASGIAAGLEAYISENDVLDVFASAVTDENGMAYFTDLETGVYLVMQQGFSSKGYFSEIESFIVQVPMMSENGKGWDYTIEAQPKVKPESTPVPTPAPTATPDPDEEKLPQTGMLKWPIPVLGVGGLLLFSLGWIMAFGKKRKHDA